MKIFNLNIQIKPVLIILSVLVGLHAQSDLESQRNIAQLGLSLQQAREKANELTMDEARQKASQNSINLSRPDSARLQAYLEGIPLSEINKWLRLNGVNQNTTVEVICGDSTHGGTEATPPPAQPAPKQECFFGYDLFEDIPASFTPPETGPVSGEYIISPGDVLRLTVWGVTEFQYELDVDKGGRVFVPNVGQFTVANMSLDKARKRMKQWLSRSYRGLTKSPPTIFMDLSVKRLKPIKIYVLGEARNPGGHTISSYSTVFNALYSVGGPKRTGSLRNIKVMRNGKVIDKIDFYDYLVNDDTPISTVQLQNNDKLFIPLRGKTVEIEGCIKRPCKYELKPDETLTELLKYAGGIQADAYTKYIQIRRIKPIEERIQIGADHCEVNSVRDLCFEQLLRGEKTHDLYDGDRVKVFCSSDILKNYVVVQGAVCHPDTSELDEYPSNVKELIEHADGLLDEAYLKRAEIYRLEKDQTRKLISINLGRALQGDPEHNIDLKKQDILRVFSQREITDTYSVSITGPVKNPGNYELLGNMKVSDLLFKAGGLWDEEYRKKVYMQRADLIRRLENGVHDTTISFNLEKALNGNGFANKPLHPYDSLVIYPRNLNKIANKYVRMYGFVKEPGRYTYTEDMTLEDAIVAAHGFREGAYLDQIEINRPIRYQGVSTKAQKYDKIYISLMKGADLEQINYTAEDTLRALKKARNFKLQHRDIIRIKKDPDFESADFINITGEVYFPGQYTLLKRKESLYNMIKRAGGLRQDAYIQGIQLYRDTTRLTADFEKMLRYKDDNYTVLLEAGDQLHIPDKPNEVTVTGNVGSVGKVQYIKDKRVFYYINKRGGLKDRTKNIYLIHPNDEVRKVRKILGLYLCNPDCGFFMCNPKVPDGSEILVTRKEIVKREGTQIKDIAINSMTIIAEVLTIAVLLGRL